VSLLLLVCLSLIAGCSTYSVVPAGADFNQDRAGISRNPDSHWPPMIGVKFIKRQPVKQPLQVKVTVEAHKYLGNRYRYGSVPRTYDSPSDCSGLVVAVYGSFGYELPRTAAAQSRIGVEVGDRSKMQPGDLVFFRNRRGRIGHVGIYIGNSTFIHASSSNRCVVKAPLRGGIAKVVRVKES